MQSHKLAASCWSLLSIHVTRLETEKGKVWKAAIHALHVCQLGLGRVHVRVLNLPVDVFFVLRDHASLWMPLRLCLDLRFPRVPAVLLRVHTPYI